MASQRNWFVSAVGLALLGVTLLAGKAESQTYYCDVTARFTCGCVQVTSQTVCFDPGDDRILTFCTTKGTFSCEAGRVLVCPRTGMFAFGTCASHTGPMGGCTGGSFGSCT